MKTKENDSADIWIQETKFIYEIRATLMTLFSEFGGILNYFFVKEYLQCRDIWHLKKLYEEKKCLTLHHDYCSALVNETFCSC